MLLNISVIHSWLLLGNSLLYEYTIGCVSCDGYLLGCFLFELFLFELSWIRLLVHTCSKFFVILAFISLW